MHLSGKIMEQERWIVSEKDTKPLCAALEAFMAVELMTVGALSGLGKTHLCSVISILFTSARIPLAIILGGALLGLEGIWWAFSVTSIVKGIIFVCTFCWITRDKGTAKMTKLNKE